MRRGAALLALLLLGAATPVRAQDPSGVDSSAAKIANLFAPDSTNADSTGADTTSVDESALMRALAPKYTMTYEMARQTTGWVQDLTFGARVGDIRFDNKTVFDVRTDSGRDEERRDGKNTTTIRLLMIPRLPINTNLSLGRLSVVRPGEERQTDVAGLTIGTTFTQNILGVRHTLNVSGGYDSRADVSAQRLQRSESTDQGWNTSTSWKGIWSATQALDLNATVDYGLTRKNSTLQTGTEPLQENPTKDIEVSYTMGADYVPLPWVVANLTYTNTSRDNAYFLVQFGKGEEEVMNNDNTSFGASVDLKPGKNFNLTSKVSANEHSLSYQVRRDIASSGNSLSWDSVLKATVLGATVDGTVSSSKEILEPATSADTDTRTNVFEGNATRPLGAKITGQLSWLVRASQVFFSDPDPTVEIQDRDELRTKIQPGLTYRPNPRWSVNASYNRSTSRRIELNPRQASQTREDEDYSVDMGITFQPTLRTRLNQSYSIKALYSDFDYDDSQDRLLATQRIVTNITSQLTPRVDLTMEHRFTLQDSGPFIIDANGSRIFARSQRSYRQELTGDLVYRLVTWLRVQASSRFLRTDDVTEGDDTRITRRSVELRTGAFLDQTLARGLRVSGSAQRVQSSAQDSYWSVLSTVSKDF